MKFRTELTVERSGFTVSHSRRGFMAGSCFSEHIYDRLAAYRFPVVANPTGILFNPLSIAAMLERVAAGRLYGVGELCQAGGLWFSYDHHGAFSCPSAEETLEGINRELERGHEALSAADYVILTFGTAWVYRLAGDGRVVANCHKQPASEFRREMADIDEIVDAYRSLLRGVLAGKQVLFTVSPVRHVRDGFEDNSLSKAVLRVAVARLAEEFPNVWYFPSFEIVNDDLRDYRFYAEDMVHPSQQAVDYIWEKFGDFAMDGSVRALLPKLGRLNAAMGHRVMRGGSGVAVFCDHSLELVAELQKALPEVDFSRERTHFEQMRAGM